MSYRILQVAYPFAPVGPGAVGGAEQVLSMLDTAVSASGHQSLVLASAGSQICGEHFPVAEYSDRITPEYRIETHRRYRDALSRLENVDLVHMHGIDFHDYLPPDGVPTLVTLHLPLDWYPRGSLSPRRENTHLHGVSRSQHRSRPPGVELLRPIDNGVDLGLYRPRAKRRFCLCLSRICPEKGLHLAMDAARLAKVPLLLAGRVYPYPAHQQYFRAEIEPRLNSHHRFVGPATGAKKSRLLSAARCLLVPSLAQETSSLVAMEALASGTPVIAFRSGALPEVVDHGRTGFIVADKDEMAAAIQQVDQIDPAACRAAAEKRFDVRRASARYLRLYERLITGSGRHQWKTPAQEDILACLSR